jgi:HEPN domain-containing protein
MDKLQLAKEWFTIAETDINSANYLMQMRPMPNEVICYHCQQSAEKYLKGFLVYQNHSLVKTHDLTVLNTLCIEYDKSFSKINEECLLLTDYGVNIRYPFSLEINLSDVKMALNNSIKIQSFIINKLPH